MGRLVGKSLWVGWWVRVCGLVGEGRVSGCVRMGCVQPGWFTSTPLSVSCYVPYAVHWIGQRSCALRDAKMCLYLNSSLKMCLLPQ